MSFALTRLLGFGETVKQTKNGFISLEKHAEPNRTDFTINISPAKLFKRSAAKSTAESQKPPTTVSKPGAEIAHKEVAVTASPVQPVASTNFLTVVADSEVPRNAYQSEKFPTASVAQKPVGAIAEPSEKTFERFRFLEMRNVQDSVSWEEVYRRQEQAERETIRTRQLENMQMQFRAQEEARRAQEEMIRAQQYLEMELETLRGENAARLRSLGVELE